MAQSGAEELTFPSPVVFKGVNDYYLRVWNPPTDETTSRLPKETSTFLQFSGTKFERESQFEVIHHVEGNAATVAIKSLHNGKYWSSNLAENGKLIKKHQISPVDLEQLPPYLATTPHSSGVIAMNTNKVDAFTLFKPIKMKYEQVIFQHKNTNQYCQLYDFINKKELSSYVGGLYCMFTVEEPVIKRSIRNLIFGQDIEDIVSFEPVIIHQKNITNETHRNQDFTVNYRRDYKRGHCFKRSVSFKTGVETDIMAKLPYVVEGVVKVSELIAEDFEWGTMKEEPLTLSGAVVIKDVKPGQSVKVTIKGQRSTLNIAFQYLQIDCFSDGQGKSTTLPDGIFHEVTEYYTTYEVVNL